MRYGFRKKIDNHNAGKQRKFDIFKTLLATRADTLSLEHVKALNSIDLEFYGESDICSSWELYRKHLNSPAKGIQKGVQEIWLKKRLELFTNLLACMSKYFDYNFDKALLESGAYSPMAHGLVNEQQEIIRNGFVGLFSGAVPLKIQVTNDMALQPKNYM